jgi:hypothetical protein
MILMNIISLALAGLARTTSGAAARLEHPVVADSVVDGVLTADQVASFVAVFKALGPYWKAHNHTALLRTAEYTRHSTAYRLEGPNMRAQPLVIYDYPLLVKKDAALAAIFTKNHFASQQFASTVKVMALAYTVVYMEQEWMNGRTIQSSATLSKNKELVRPYYKSLEAAGFMETFHKGTGGYGTGDDDDLDP